MSGLIDMREAAQGRAVHFFKGTMAGAYTPHGTHIYIINPLSISPRIFKTLVLVFRSVGHSAYILRCGAQG